VRRCIAMGPAMSASANCAVREVIAVAGLLGFAAVLAWLRPLPARLAPAPLPAASCAAWMADAIPGVGARTSEAVAAGVRSGRVPAKAAGWFSGVAP
jgi:hypothetical protein